MLCAVDGDVFLFVGREGNQGRRVIGTVHQQQGQRVFHMLADDPAQVTGAAVVAVSLGGNGGQCLLVIAELDALFAQGFVGLVQHQGGNAFKVLHGQLAEYHHFVHTSKEFGPQEFAQRLHHLFLFQLAAGLVEAKTAALGA